MTKQKLKKDYNVDADKVKWQRSMNGRYVVSDRICHGCYLIKYLGCDDYDVVVAVTNSISNWRCDLSEMEG